MFGDSRAQRGTTLFEVMIFLLLAVPLMVALISSITIFTRTTATSHHRTTTNGQAHKILQKIMGELVQTSTRLDHATFGAPTPQPDAAPQNATNPAYNFVAGQALETIGELHDTTTRDGSEHWTTLQDIRRFYIYATYRPFDTIEYQKIRTPLDEMGHLSTANQTISQPWSARRKIFLEDRTVFLRVETPGGGTKTAVLGTHVDALRFHLNADGHVIVRITSRSGDVEGSLAGGQNAATNAGCRLTAQVTVAPRNELF